MILLSWNYRGLDNPATVLALCELVKARRPDIIFLYEILSIASRIEEIIVKLNFQSCFNVNCVGRSGGVCFFWRVSTLCNVVSYSKNHISLSINVRVVLGVLLVSMVSLIGMNVFFL